MLAFSVVERGLPFIAAEASHCCGFSRVKYTAGWISEGSAWLSSCGLLGSGERVIAVALGLAALQHVGSPGPGMELVPVLLGGFLTTDYQGSP